MNELMKKWKKGIVLTTDRGGLPGQIQCAECGGIISLGTKFYIEDYVEDKFCLTTRFFHFNCVQRAENRTMPDPEIAKIKKALDSIFNQKGVAAEEMARAEEDLADLEREERGLRERIGKLVDGEGGKDATDQRRIAKV